MQGRLTDGALAIHIRSLGEHERILIDTPNATVMLRQPGEYAIETEDDGERTRVKVRKGEAEVTGFDQHGYVVGANQQGVFTGADELSSVMTQPDRRSMFETWANEREARADQSLAARYVAPGVVGYQDLDTYGTWSHEPDYGNVWQPSTTYVFNDWAPYRYGRWLWMSPWGWTWVDDAPWGYASSHYGRWTYLRQRWCWVPGPRHVRATYAPALVAWVGPPSFGVEFREVGWLPLGPREVYIPGHRNSWRYFRNVNHSNAGSIDNTFMSNAYYGRGQHVEYRNRGMPHAVTVVDRDSFVSARRTNGRRVDVDADDLQRWREQGRAPSIKPNLDSRHGGRPTGWVPAPHLDRQAIASRQRPAGKPRTAPEVDSLEPDSSPFAPPLDEAAAFAADSGERIEPPGADDPTVDLGAASDAVPTMPSRNARPPTTLHRDTPIRTDRPHRTSSAQSGRAPAPVATPSDAAPPQMTETPNDSTQPVLNKHQRRQERHQQERASRPDRPPSANEPAQHNSGIQTSPAPAGMTAPLAVQPPRAGGSVEPGNANNPDRARNPQRPNRASPAQSGNAPADPAVPTSIGGTRASSQWQYDRR